MIKEDYKFGLTDPRWIYLADRIKERDKCCQKCGSFENLNVHHTFYDRNKMPWEYEDEYLITLCNRCHKNEHGDIKRLRDVIKEMMKHCIWADEIRQKIQPLIK